MLGIVILSVAKDHYAGESARIPGIISAHPILPFPQNDKRQEPHWPQGTYPPTPDP